MTDAAREDFANQITLDAPCKINLFLEVTGKRPDGYHEIDTVMQTVGLCDRLTVRFDREARGISLSCTKKYIPTDGSNVIWRCAAAFLEKTGIEGGVTVTLNKRIPVAAGLGGGSADGAAVLKALNQLTNTPLSEAELCGIGAGVGADIPFCIKGGCMRATGIGEVFSHAEPLRRTTAVIAIGGHGSSTPAAYKALDDAGYTGSRTAEKMLAALKEGKASRIAEEMYNAFAPVIAEKNREIEVLKARMLSLSAWAAMMSGSGAAVYGLFSGWNAAKKAANALRAEGYFAVTAPIL